MAVGIPEPVHGPDGLTYEGRLLDRPEEEVVDQGASFDLGTLVSRRRLLLAGLAGMGTLALAACSPQGGSVTVSPDVTDGSTTDATGEIPDETAGPYPGDGSNGPDVLNQSGIVRSDIRSSIGQNDPVSGDPLEFTLSVVDMANSNAPFVGAAVYAWHCDAEGRYSMYSEGVENETWLRGVQVADANGNVTFTSVLPGCYPGRWTHIHFEVYPDVASITDASNAIATSQLAFPENVLTAPYQQAEYGDSARNLAQITLATDNVFGDDAAALQLATVTGSETAGLRATLLVRVDTNTVPTAGGMASGSGGPSGSGGQPPSGGPGGPGGR